MSYLGDLDARFSSVSEHVIKHGVQSALSNNPAEIIHHTERRLTHPESILDEDKLIPITGLEHALIHDGKIQIIKTADGFRCIDANGARFKLKLAKFKEIWREELMQNHST
jgi:hypothetical protein